MLLQEKKRLDYIDWAKAVSIVLIVLGHMLPSGCWPKVLAYAFHVPIFALIGGVLFKAPETWQDVGKKSLGLLKRLVIPYLIWFAVFCSFYFKVPEEIPEVAVKTATTDFGQLLKYFFFYEGKTVWNAAMWFMPCYIILSYLFLFFNKLVRGSRIASACLSFVSFATVLILEKKEITINRGEVENVFGMKNYFLLLGFLAIGYAIRPLLDACARLTENPRKNPIPYVSVFAFVAISVACLKFNAVEITAKKPAGYYTISMYSGLYNNMLMFVIFALLLSVTLMIALMLLPGLKNVRLLSENSLFIMLTHYFFFLDDSFRQMKSALWGPLKKKKWGPYLDNPDYGLWELDMSVAFRDTAYIIVVFVLLLIILRALIKKYPKLRHFFTLLGIQ